MAQVVNGQGRLTPDQRQALLDVSATRMKELRGALDTRMNPYEGIITRNNMTRQDVLPGFNELPEVPPLKRLTLILFQKCQHLLRQDTRLQSWLLTVTITCLTRSAPVNI